MSAPTVSPRFVLADSVTALDAVARGQVVVSGSHAARFAAGVAARAGVRAVVLNDAGIGRDGAGVAGLELLDELGLPAVAVSHLSAAIGDARDTLDSGVVSRTNAAARRLGCRPGMLAVSAVRALACAPEAAAPPVLPDLVEARCLLRPGVWALDSASLARADDAGTVLVTGSHGRLLGGRPETALRAEARAAIFNDAGRPDVGTRLPALDARGIAAAVVAADSARIGDGRSSFHDGVISAVNGAAACLGGGPGMSARDFVELAVPA